MIMRKMNDNVNIRLSTDDSKVLREEAKKRRLSFSALCREKITRDIVHNEI